MSAPPVKVLCTDWPPPSDVSELPAAAFLISTLWKPGQTVTIDFIDSRAAPWKKAWVEKVVTEMVQPYVNLDLKFGNYGRQADIRITFRHENSAYSRLGTQSTWYKGSKEQPESMNLGWLDEPHSGTFRWKGQTYTFPGCTYCSKNTNGSVIIHEFGHALGMVHEHQNPTGGIQWNEQAVLNYFSGAPNYWDEEQIRFNVMDKYDSNLLNASQYDPKSIMLYAFPASLTLNGVATQANAVMSPTDIEWMGKVYGDTKETKKKKKREDKKRKLTSGETVAVGNVIINLEPDGSLQVDGVAVFPDEKGVFRVDGDVVAYTDEQGGVVVVTEEDEFVVTGEGGDGVTRKKKNTALIVGVAVSVAVLAIVLGVVFGVIIPRKRARN